MRPIDLHHLAAVLVLCACSSGNGGAASDASAGVGGTLQSSNAGDGLLGGQGAAGASGGGGAGAGGAAGSAGAVAGNAAGGSGGGAGALAGAGGASGTGGSTAPSGTDVGYCDDYERWPEDQTPCASDDDCPGDMRCQDTWFTLPCTLGCATTQVGCLSDVECAPEVCQPQRIELPPPPELVPLPPLPVCNCGSVDSNMRCSAPCIAGSCADDEICGSDGLCSPKRCDTDGYACLDGYTCDPAAVMGYLAGQQGHGCRGLRCDEPGSQPCAENTRCTAGANGGLCLALPCETSSDCDCGTCRARLLNPADPDAAPVKQCQGRPGICVANTTPGF